MAEGEPKLEFTKRFLVLGNLGLLIWMFLASALALFYSPVYGWLYLFLLFVMAYGVLRRLGCSSCYLCKECTGGFGRLVGDLFGRGYIKKASVGNRLGAVVVMYVLLLPIPVVFVVLGGFCAASVAVLSCLLAVSVYSLSTWCNR